MEELEFDVYIWFELGLVIIGSRNRLMVMFSSIERIDDFDLSWLFEVKLCVIDFESTGRIDFEESLYCWLTKNYDRLVEICGHCFGKKVDGMGRRRSMLVDRWLDENERCDFVKWMYLISNEALVFAVDVDDFESMASN